MTLQQLLQSYDFEEIFPEVGLMYPHARRKRKEFATAYMLLREMKPQVTKRQIRYQLMQDPNTNEMFFGADDACFAESGQSSSVRRLNATQVWTLPTHRCWPTACSTVC